MRPIIEAPTAVEKIILRVWKVSGTAGKPLKRGNAASPPTKMDLPTESERLLIGSFNAIVVTVAPTMPAREGGI